jgi:hypothetical protein
MIDGEAKRYECQRTRSFYFEHKLAWDYAQLYSHPPIFRVKDTPRNKQWIAEVVAQLRLGEPPRSN